MCRYVCVCVCVCNVYKCPQRPLRAGVELLDVNAKNQADVLWKGIDTRVRFNRDISSLDDTFMKSARVWPSLAVKGRHKLNFPQLFWH